MPLHATIEEFAAEGYTHLEANCPRCRKISLRPIDQLPKISMGLTLDALARRLRCAECGGPLRSVKPWRQADELGKPQGQRADMASETLRISFQRYSSAVRPPRIAVNSSSVKGTLPTRTPVRVLTQSAVDRGCELRALPFYLAANLGDEFTKAIHKMRFGDLVQRLISIANCFEGLLRSGHDP